MSIFRSVPLIGFLATLGASQLGAGTDGKDLLKEKLKQRYPNDAFVQFVQTGLYAGEYLHDSIVGSAMKVFGGRKYDISTSYWHFNEPTADPRPYKSSLKGATPVDDKTFQQLRDAYAGSPIAADEKLRIIDLSVGKDSVTFLLEADQMRHGGAGATATRMTVRETNKTTNLKGSWGLEYNFVFAKAMIESGDYDGVVAEINHVLVPFKAAHPGAAPTEVSPTSPKASHAGPASEAPPRGTAQVGRQATAPQEQEIKIGMSREQVLRMLGQPRQVTKFGSKEILKYPDLSVVLENGKVVDVKI